MIRYYSKKSYTYYITLVLLLAVLCLPVWLEKISFSELLSEGFLFYTLFVLVFLGLFVWMFAATYYEVRDSFLGYRCGPFFGKIPIANIQKIKYHKGILVPVTFKVSLDGDGLIVVYNKFSEIFISPEDKEGLIRELLRKNPKIQIEKK